jgi:hypothetical protein
VNRWAEAGLLDWKPYDPAWLVALARQQQPNLPWLGDALAACTRASLESTGYLRFVDPRNPNQSGSEWQFDENIILRDPNRGDLVLDILKGHRVGGVEFLANL